MAWRLKMKARKAPPGMELLQDELQRFDSLSREALNTPSDDKRRNEITWPMHKLHYQKNRYIYDMYYRERKISKPLLDYLIHEKVADGKLLAKWKRTGYETLCSLAVITKSNTNFQSTGICRVPLHTRKGQILPNVLTGCVSCASGDKGPIWWDDPIPFVVKKRIVQIDPGKIELLDADEQVRLLAEAEQAERDEQEARQREEEEEEDENEDGEEEGGEEDDDDEGEGGEEEEEDEIQVEDSMSMRAMAGKVVKQARMKK